MIKILTMYYRRCNRVDRLYGRWKMSDATAGKLIFFYLKKSINKISNGGITWSSGSMLKRYKKYRPIRGSGIMGAIKDGLRPSLNHYSAYGLNQTWTISQTPNAATFQ